MRKEENAQVHILEMLTLFWLFFMSATFLIRIDVPDSPSIAHDSSLETAGESAFLYGLGLEAVVEGENRLTELLNNMVITIEPGIYIPNNTYNPYINETVVKKFKAIGGVRIDCLLYTSPSPRDRTRTRMPSSA